MHLEKRILVTGGASFLGSHLCERVLRSNRAESPLPRRQTSPIGSALRSGSLVERGIRLDPPE